MMGQMKAGDMMGQMKGKPEEKDVTDEKDVKDKKIYKDTYEEAETKRIDGLIEQLKEEKRRLRKDMKEKPPKKYGLVETHRIGESALARIVFGMLGGWQKEFDVRRTAGMSKNVYIEFHSCRRLGSDELRVLERVPSYGGPEDGEPYFDIDVYACNEHIDCLVVEFDVWFSDNDWTRLTK